MYLASYFVPPLQKGAGMPAYKITRALIGIDDEEIPPHHLVKKGRVPKAQLDELKQLFYEGLEFLLGADAYPSDPQFAYDCDLFVRHFGKWKWVGWQTYGHSTEASQQ